MKLNGHYIDAVTKWNTKLAFKEHINTEGQIYNKDVKTDSEHTIEFIVKHDQTAKELTELFSNQEFNIAIVEDLEDEYNGIYNLIKGSIEQKRGKTYYNGKLWLSNKTDTIRHVEHIEEIDSDFSYFQTEIDAYDSLINYSTSGSFTNDGANGFYSSSGTLQFGFAHWNSFIFECDVLPDGATTVFHFHKNDSGNLYEFKIDESANTFTVTKTLEGTSSTLFTETRTFVNTQYYNFKVIYSAGKFEIFIDNSHVHTLYDYDLVSGTMGVNLNSTTTRVRNLSVKKYRPHIHNPSAGFEDLDNVNHQSYIKNQNGLQQNIVNPDSEIEVKEYPSRVLQNDVRVWDTMDNDFSFDYIPPKPLMWERVYSVDHNFTGKMFVENGLYGILYDDEFLIHYVYDKGYRKGDLFDIDFKQNPNKKIWNDSYSNRDITSFNQGQSNFDENGLNFEALVGRNDERNEDIVWNDTNMPELDESYLLNVGDKLEMRVTPTEKDGVADGLLGFICGIKSNSTNARIDFTYDHVGQHFQMYVNDNGTVKDYFENDNESPINQTYDIVFINDSSTDGFSVYKDGVLIKWDNGSNGQFHFSESGGGVFTIGNPISGTWNNQHFQGNIEYIRHSTMSRGEAVPRSLKQPLVWYSFDEKDWNNSTRTFEDKGTKGVDISITVGTPQMVKNGRYNQAIYLKNDYFSSALTTELDNLTGFTIEAWIKIHALPANYVKMFEAGDLTGLNRTMGFYILSTDNITLAFGNGVNDNQLVVSMTPYGISTDGQWHHVAGTYDGANMKIYIDGVERGDRAETDTPASTPPNLYVGHYSGSSEIEIDEVMVFDYAKQPEEFDLIIPEQYNLGQWYSKAEVEQKDGKWRKKNNKKSSKIEIDYINSNLCDRISGTNAESVTAYNDLAIKNGYSGVSVNGLSSNGRIKFQETKFRTENGWTLQFYYSADTILTGILFWFIRNSGDTSLYPQISSSKFDFAYSGGNGSRVNLIDNSYTLTAGQIYHVAYVFDDNWINPNVKIYVNGELYRSVTSVEGTSGNELEFVLGLAGNTFNGTLSNITIHEEQLSPSEFGIIVDRDNQIPKPYAIYNAYASHELSGYILKSISPDYVQVDVLFDEFSVNESFIERDSYVYKVDFTDSVDINNSLRVGFQVNFKEQTNFDKNLVYNPTTAITLGDNSTGESNLWHTPLERTDKSLNLDSSKDSNELLVFGDDYSNMVGVFASERDNTSTYNYYAGHTNGKIWRIINTSRRAMSYFGFVPQRDLNETFWDATMLFNHTPDGFSNESGNYFLTSFDAGGFSKIHELDGVLNYNKYRRGLYLIISKDKVEDASINVTLGMYNASTGYHFSTLTSSLSFVYQYGYFNATSFTELYDMILYTYKQTSDTTYKGYTDYIIAIPLTNGYDMPLDLLRNSMVKRRKKRILKR